MEEKKIQILKSCTELTETRVDSTLIFDGSVLHVYKDKIRLPDGKLSSREYMHHVGAVCVLPLTKEKEVICVRQYRYACAQVLLEIPAGKLDAPDEPHLEAAVRELREETGAVGATMTYLGPLLTSPALLDEVIHMYLAEDFTMGETDFDDDEFLEIVKIPLDEMVRMVMRGEIPDAKTQTAVMRAQALLAARET